jgi:hypothetical protein
VAIRIIGGITDTDDVVAGSINNSTRKAVEWLSCPLQVMHNSIKGDDLGFTVKGPVTRFYEGIVVNVETSAREKYLIILVYSCIDGVTISNNFSDMGCYNPGTIFTNGHGHPFYNLSKTTNFTEWVGSSSGTGREKVKKSSG